MKIARLRGRKTVERLRKRGRKWRGKHMTVTYVRGQGTEDKGQVSSFVLRPQSPVLSVGTLASSHLHKSAVKRNRMRRRCREALRITLRDAPLRGAPQGDTACQLLIAPRSSSLTCAFEELLSDARSFLDHLHHAA